MASASAAVVGGKNVSFVSKTSQYFSFAPNVPPAVEIESGDVVVVETGDVAYQRMSQGTPMDHLDDDRFNSIHGPIWVKSASPGDALRVDVLDISIERAWVCAAPDYGMLGSKVKKYIKQQTMLPVRFEEEEEEEKATKPGDTEAKTVFRRYACLSERLRVPVEPMIGCIGTAPAAGKLSTLLPIHTIGGNMDLRELGKGASILLPVRVAGALLSLGDVHACMGQGEPCTIALESAARVTIRVTVVPASAPPGYPRLRLKSHLASIGVGSSLKAARVSALASASEWVTEIMQQEAFNIDHRADNPQQERKRKAPKRLVESAASAYVSQHAQVSIGGPADFIMLAKFPYPVTQRKPDGTIEAVAPPHAVALGPHQNDVQCPVKSHDLEHARHKAVNTAFDVLRTTYGLTPLEAYGYCCAKVAVHIQNPTQTSTNMVASFPPPVLNVHDDQDGDKN